MLCQIRETLFDPEKEEWTFALEACGESHYLHLRNPFSTEDDEEVDWYFQRHSRFPLIDTVRAAKVVNAIGDYGQELFRQTIGAIPFSSLSRRYQEMRLEGTLNALCIEISGSAAFQRLHWEALKDNQPGVENSLVALQVDIIRRPLITRECNPPAKKSNRPRWSLPSRPLNILLVVARPAGARDVGLRVISRPLLDVLQSVSLDENLRPRLDVVRPGSFEELQKMLEKASSRGLQYDIVHFDLHGKLSRDRKQVLLSFQAQNGDGGNDVPGSTVASLLKQFNVPMVVLNACSSAYETGQDNSSIGSILAMSGISYVIAMRYDIPIASAATAVQALYLTLLSKRSTSGLIAAVRKQIFQDQSLGRFHGFSYLKLDWLLPIAYIGEHPSPAYFTTVQPSFLGQETASRYALVSSLEFGAYRAIRGREIDVLQIETILSMKPDCKTVLIHGLSGVGKTALLRHLSWWWAATGLTTKVLWLDMAECKGSIPEMMTHLAHLLSLTGTSNSHCLTVPGFKESFSKTLSSERYMLVFENIDIAQDILQNNKDNLDTQAFMELCRDLCADATITLIEQRTPHQRMLGRSYHSHHLLGIDEAEILELASIQVSQVVQGSVKHSDLARLAQHCNGLPGVVEELGQSLLSSPTDLDLLLNSFDPWHHPEKLNTTQNLLANISFTEKGRDVVLTAEERQILSCFTLLKVFVCKTDLRRYIRVRTQMTQRQPVIDATVFERLLERLLLLGLVTYAEEQSFLTEQKSDLLEFHPLLSVRLRQKVEEVADESSKELAFVKVFCEEARSYMKVLVKAHEQQQQKIFGMLRFNADNFFTAMVLAIRHRQVNEALSLQHVLMSHHRKAKSYQEGAAVCRLFLDQLSTLNIEGANILKTSLLQDQGQLLSSAEEFSDAETCFVKALGILNELKDQGECDIFRLLTYWTLGVLAFKKGSYREGFDQFNSGSKLYESKANPTPAWKAMQGRFLIGQALCRINMHDEGYATASEYLKQARDNALSRKDKEDIASIDAIAYLLNEDDDQVRQQRFKQAKSYFLRNGEPSRVVSMSAFPALDGMNFGIGNQAEAPPQKMVKTLQSALDSDNVETTENALILLGSHELNTNNHDQAKTYIELALQFNETHRSRNSLTRVHAYRMLGCIALERSEWDRAKDLFQQALGALREMPENVMPNQEDTLLRFLGWAGRKYNPLAALAGGSVE